MNVIKKSFTYGKKLSKNFNSVSVSEGFEMEVADVDATIDLFELQKADVMRRVDNLAEQAMSGKPALEKVEGVKVNLEGLE